MWIVDNFKKYFNIESDSAYYDKHETKKENDLTGVLIINLGTPDYFESKDIRRYLMEFLSDRKIINIPKLIWLPVLYFVSLLRSKKLEQSYAKIWMRDGSPLVVYSKRQIEGLENRLGSKDINSNIKLVLGMRYGKPSIKESINELVRGGCNKILVLPLYPQYSYTTTASSICEVYDCVKNFRDLPNIRFIKRFYNEDFYIEFLAKKINSFWDIHGKPKKLIMSFHGLSMSSINHGDPYYSDCINTYNLLVNKLNIEAKDVEFSFQSNLSFSRWLKPYTANLLKKLARNGIDSIDVVCPGFVSDCLETLEEVKEIYKRDFLEAGGKEFRYIPAPNDDKLWLDQLSLFIKDKIKDFT